MLFSVVCEACVALECSECHYQFDTNQGLLVNTGSCGAAIFELDNSDVVTCAGADDVCIYYNLDVQLTSGPFSEVYR